MGYDWFALTFLLVAWKIWAKTKGADWKVNVRNRARKTIAPQSTVHACVSICMCAKYIWCAALLPFVHLQRSFFFLYSRQFQLHTHETIILRFLDRLRCQMVWHMHSLHGPYNFPNTLLFMCCDITVRLLISIESCIISIFFHSFHVMVSRLRNASEGKR